MNEIITQLEHLRRCSRWLLVGQRLILVAAWIIAAILAATALDYLLHLPGGVRLVMLAAGLSTLGWAGRVYIWPALRFSPSLVQLALRVESRLPGLSGRLASGVEFAICGTAQSNSLARRTVREAQRRMAGQSVLKVIDSRRAWTGAGAVIGMTVIATAAVLAYPASAQVGLKRLFLPFSAATWPSRTGVVSLMNQVAGEHMVFPRQRILTLRAQVTKGPADQRVTARYRLLIDGSFQRWRSVLLTHQVNGRHERLIDANAEAIQLQFVTEDSRTEFERIDMVAPAEVIEARLTVTPPEYAAGRWPVLREDLGSGTDDRSVTSTPSLVGSKVRLRLEMSKPLPVPETDASGRRAEWIRSTFGWTGEVPATFSVDSRSPRHWLLEWRLADTRSLSLHVVDENGLANSEPIVYRIEAVEDHAPGVAITEPEHDEAVLGTAVLALAAEAHDDVAMCSIGLEASIKGPSEDEAAGPPAWTETRAVNAASATIRAELDLGGLQPGEGDEVQVRAVAQDEFMDNDVQRPAVRSSPRKFRVVSRSEMAGQLRRQLGAVRQNVIRIEAVQRELQDEFAAEDVQPGLDQAQTRLARRISEQRRAVDAIIGQVRRNRLEDAVLLNLLERSKDILDEAEWAANRAAQAIEERLAESSPDPAAPEGRMIFDAQQDVREELAFLVELLDSDEDAWVAIRRVEELLRRQTDLEEQTRKLGLQTLGRARQELEEETVQLLDGAAGQQEQLKGEAEKAIDDLRRRAGLLEKADPQAAAGLRSAADTADSRRLATDMSSAADQIGRNQLRLASASQQSAIQTLQRMLEDIEKADEARVAELLRRLADLAESIGRLIEAQESELTALRIAEVEQSFTGRDLEMIRLKRNTASVADEARDVGSSTRRVVMKLSRAGGEQDAAIEALREEPVNAEHAEGSEERSLRLLKEAEELAKELHRQIHAQQQRRQQQELINAYRDLAEREDALRADTLPLLGLHELDRRGLRQARLCASRQEEIRLDLSRLRDDTEEMAETVVFRHVHRKVDDWARMVRDALAAGSPTPETPEKQRMIADSLARLAEALEELEAPPEEFASEDQRGGGGGGGIPPLIPPVAELKLLHGLQEQIYNETKTIDGRADLDASSRRVRLEEIGRRQRELVEISRLVIERMGETSPPQSVEEER